MGRIVKTSAISRSLADRSPLARVAFALIRRAEPSALRRFRAAYIKHPICRLDGCLRTVDTLILKSAFIRSAHSVTLRNIGDSLSSNRCTHFVEGGLCVLWTIQTHRA